MADENEPLTRAEWREWLDNDWGHLCQSVSWIKGVMWVLIPLVIFVLGTLVAVLIKVIK